MKYLLLISLLILTSCFSENSIEKNNEDKIKTNVSEKNDKFSFVKIEEDLNNLLWIIQSKIKNWANTKDFVIMNDDYFPENLYIDSNKNDNYLVKMYIGSHILVKWENYFVWTINYNKLWIIKEDYLDPNGDEYLIWASSLRWWVIQVTSVFKDLTNKITKIKIRWNHEYSKKIEFKNLVDYKILWDRKIEIFNDNFDKLFIWDIITSAYVNKYTILNKKLQDSIIEVNEDFKEDSFIIEESPLWLIYYNWTYLQDGSYLDIVE